MQKYLKANLFKTKIALVPNFISCSYITLCTSVVQSDVAIFFYFEVYKTIEQLSDRSEKLFNAYHVILKIGHLVGFPGVSCFVAPNCPCGRVANSVCNILGDVA